MEEGFFTSPLSKQKPLPAQLLTQTTSTKECQPSQGVQQVKSSNRKRRDNKVNFDCVTVKNTEWDHDFSDTNCDEKIFR